MKPATMTNTLVCTVYAICLLSLGGCQIKSVGVQVGNEAEPVVVTKPKPKADAPHAPAYGHRAKCSYQYYPSCYVYFNVS